MKTSLLIVISLIGIIVNADAWPEVCTDQSYCEASFPSTHNYIDLPKGFKWKKSFVIFRHGDRTPVRTTDQRWGDYLNSSLDKSNWMDNLPVAQKEPTLAGQLTFLGENQLRRLGVNLAEIYPVKEEGVVVYSTPYARTVLSARSLLSGLFPDTHKRLIVNLKERSQHHIIPGHDSAPVKERFKASYKRISEDLIYQTFEDLRKQIDNKASSEEFFQIADNYFCEACHGWSVSDKNLKKVEKYCKVSKTIFSYLLRRSAIEKDIVKSRSGSLLNDIKHFFEDSIHDLHLYAAHDSTIAHLLVALGATNHDWPPYASNLILELVHSKNSDYVRMIYNGGETSLSCGDDEKIFSNEKNQKLILCPISKFISSIMGLTSEQL